MQTRKSIFVLMALGIALGGVAGCKKKKQTQQPQDGVTPEQAALDPTKASAEAKASFADVTKAYDKAKADGSLSSGECSSLAEQYMDVYKKYGEQMTVAWFNAGAVWDECGQTEKAEEIYQAVVKAVPKYDLSYNNLGVIYWGRKQEAKALDYFKRAVEANATTRAPRNNLAAALRNKYSQSPQQDDFVKAERELQTVLAVDSGNQLAYENLARLYYDRGRLKDKSYLLLADLVITQALRVLEKEKKDSADIWNLRGLLLMERDDQVAALKSFKKAADINPKHADAHMNIAMISIRFRDYKAAETSLAVAVKDNRQKKNVETYLGMGVAQRGLRKYKEAEDSFKKAMELKADDPRPLFNLGVLYQDHVAPNQQEGADFNKKPYQTAQDYFRKFSSKAGGSGSWKESVTDANQRVAAIDQLFKDIEEMKKLEAEAKKLEEQQKKQEEEERKRYLDLEKKAREAAAKAAEEDEPAAPEAKPEAKPDAAKAPK
jgi:tetratricopeptide (TPR) repeat protein